MYVYSPYIRVFSRPLIQSLSAPEDCPMTPFWDALLQLALALTFSFQNDGAVYSTLPLRPSRTILSVMELFSHLSIVHWQRYSRRNMVQLMHAVDSPPFRLVEVKLPHPCIKL